MLSMHFLTISGPPQQFALLQNWKKCLSGIILCNFSNNLAVLLNNILKTFLHIPLHCKKNHW